MGQKKAKKHDPRPSPTPPPETPQNTSLDAQEARLLAQLERIRMEKQTVQPATAATAASPPPSVTGSVITQVPSNTANSDPPASHHTSTAPARRKAPIPRVPKIKNLAAYLEESVQMDKAMYNFFLRVVRSACGIVKLNDTWKTLSHEKKNIILHAITDEKDNKPLLPYLRNRFENDWVIETAIIRHLQERKRGKKRAAESLESDESAPEAQPSTQNPQLLHDSRPSTSAASTPPSVAPTPKALSPNTLDQMDIESSTGSVPAAPTPASRSKVAIPNSATTPALPLSPPSLIQATRAPLTEADTNVNRDMDASTSTTQPPSKPMPSTKKGAKRKVPEVMDDVATSENRRDEPQVLTPAPPLKKPRTKKTAPALPPRSNPKRSTRPP
ncbi:hypothetical protein M407DRAFT_29049 [Tulasnella calospora MUT 4182]|uniref:Uncharacterized protein n=1 Tax=Tulasnella calospora MUT 4182 TaxID=1051891 RepID=A0A0C3Q9M7_9AGAM|nr:hypothetical protein M407DRAFT_29049 [Tulasnella calospora MUT 4182]